MLPFIVDAAVVDVATDVIDVVLGDFVVVVSPVKHDTSD